MKFWLERMGTDDVVAEAMKESALAWLVFLTQLAVILFAFFLLLTLIRYLRVFNKRRRALKDLKRAAKESNFYYRQVGNCYRSLFKNFDRPYVTLERGMCVMPFVLYLLYGKIPFCGFAVHRSTVSIASLVMYCPIEAQE